MAKITMDCFGAECVMEFMGWLSVERSNSASTCNQRLMVLRSFAQYNGAKDFSQFSLYAEIKSVPTKKSSPKTAIF